MVFAPASLILTNYYLPLSEALHANGSYQTYKDIKMFHKILVILFAISPLSAFAEFKSNDWNDEMSDTKTIERYVRASTDRFGFRCDIDAKGKDFMLTFASDDSIATPNSTVEIKIRIDKGEVHNLKGKLYSNSYKSGLIRTFQMSCFKRSKRVLNY